MINASRVMAFQGCVGMHQHTHAMITGPWAELQLFKIMLCAISVLRPRPDKADPCHVHTTFEMQLLHDAYSVQCASHPSTQARRYQEVFTDSHTCLNPIHNTHLFQWGLIIALHKHTLPQWNPFWYCHRHHLIMGCIGGAQHLRHIFKGTGCALICKNGGQFCTKPLCA